MILVCGEALFDFFNQISADGQLKVDARPGGSPFNVAIGLARLGVETAFLGGISNDLLGQQLIGYLEAEGVDTRYVVRPGKRTTISIVARGRDGLPSYAFYGDDGADRSVSAANLPPLEERVSAIHCGSYTLVAPPISDAISELILRDRGQRLISLDPNVRPSIEPDMAVWRRRIDTLMPHVGVVKVSDEDLGLLYPGRHTDEICQQWLAAGPSLVVLTRGSHGAVAFSNAGRVSVPGLVVPVVDVVGAGDAFQAALLQQLRTRSALSRSRVAALSATAIAEILEFACAAAADTCTRRGADPPSLAMLTARRHQRSSSESAEINSTTMEPL